MSGTMYFLLSVAALIGGYFIYGAFVENVFGIDRNRPTPVTTKKDGMDYVEMPGWKIFLIQLLNIAGLGPVFGPILGALYGPAALLWVVFGCIFAGATHDFITGMMSLRYGGASYPEVIGRNLGGGVRRVMQGYTVIFLILVGAVFVTGPAGLLASITPPNLLTWSIIIFAYYFLATIMPIDVIIGRIYPFFAALLVIMAVGLMIALMLNPNYTVLPDTNFLENLHPKNLPLWPVLFITIACGAISGFHATQSPMMTRCMTNESHGRLFFYGSMIAEGIIALIWVTLGLSFYGGTEGLAEALGPTGNAAIAVKDISIQLLGTFGGLLAILGVVVLPVSTGDTAFRSARMLLSDILKMEQKSPIKRLILATPLFACGIALTLIDFNVIWRYFGWANQTMACVALWACSVYLYRRGKFHWITTLPAAFMTVVTVTFICNAKIGLGMDMTLSTGIGIVVAMVFLALFFMRGSTMPAGDEALY